MESVKKIKEVKLRKEKDNRSFWTCCLFLMGEKYKNIIMHKNIINKFTYVHTSDKEKNKKHTTLL